MLYKLIVRPFLFLFDEEQVHDWVSRILWAIPAPRQNLDPILSSSVAGIEFSGPVGMAAGFDKDCRTFRWIYKFGFGFVEVGTITPLPQSGNPKRRIHRIVKSEAIINKMGFPNDGLESAKRRLRKHPKRPGPLGVNIGANKDSVDRISDYVACLESLNHCADYLTINVSSPNTPGLRSLESIEHLDDLLRAVDETGVTKETPVFLKVSPDLNDDDSRVISKRILDSDIAGVIVGNTTVSRPEGIGIGQEGGLSGKPLAPISANSLRAFYRALGGKVPIISVGGIASAREAYDRIRDGASLLQIYTAFIYEGGDVVSVINKELAQLLREDGFSSIEDAVGANSRFASPRSNKRQRRTERAVEPAIA